MAVYLEIDPSAHNPCSPDLFDDPAIRVSKCLRAEVLTIILAQWVLKVQNVRLFKSFGRWVSARGIITSVSVENAYGIWRLELIAEMKNSVMIRKTSSKCTRRLRSVQTCVGS